MIYLVNYIIRINFENKNIFYIYIMYKIQPITQRNADKLGVKIFASDNPKYKLEVYDWNGQFMFYIGDSRYKDYPTYIAEKDLEYANERRRLYKIRHEKDRKVLGSKGYYAYKLLWSK